MQRIVGRWTSAVIRSRSSLIASRPVCALSKCADRLVASTKPSTSSPRFVARFSTVTPFAGATVPLSKRGSKAVVQELRSLRVDAARRRTAQQLVIFGRTLVEEFVARGGACQHVFAAPECQLNIRTDAQSSIVPLTSAELFVAAGVECAPADACAAVVSLPSLHPPPSSARRVMVLDSMGDPGNLGSMVRSAAAFDFALVLLQGPGACDPFNDKVVRSSMGAVLNAQLHKCDEAALLQLIESRRKEQPNLQLLVSDVAAAGSVSLSDLSLPPTDSVWLVVGNEAHGVRPSLRAIGRRVHIPMSHSVESLNAGIAGSILMQHVFAEQQKRQTS